jgi:hypothetical protein
VLRVPSIAIQLAHAATAPDAGGGLKRSVPGGWLVRTWPSGLVTSKVPSGSNLA